MTPEALAFYEAALSHPARRSGVLGKGWRIVARLQPPGVQAAVGARQGCRRLDASQRERGKPREQDKVVGGEGRGGRHREGCEGCEGFFPSYARARESAPGHKDRG